MISVRRLIAAVIAGEIDAGFEGKFSYPSTMDAVLVWVPEGPARHKIFSENAMQLYFG